MKIILPRRAIVVLCGAAGSGKTTFARRHFRPSQVLSSDLCRQLICDRVDWSPHISPAAFRVLHTILEERLRLGRLTVIDSTAVHPDHRSIYVKMARRFGLPAALIIMNVTDTVCIARDRRRSQRVGERAIIAQWEILQRGLESVEEEGFDPVYILDERTQFNTHVIIGTPGVSNTRRQPERQAPKPPAGAHAPCAPLISESIGLTPSVLQSNGRSLNGSQTPHAPTAGAERIPAEMCDETP
ncbi:MAG: hypothetical protein Kow0059_12950 [Candidatus Sumerlaeia bacterium]